jgi:apolipoprotein N-acyltransferase
MRAFWKSLTLPVLSGVLVGTSYIPFPPWANLFCLVPLWLYWSRQHSLKAVFWGGITCGFVFTLIGYNWVAYTLHEFAHLSWPVSVLGMLGFCLVGHLYITIAGVLWFLWQRHFQWSSHLSLFWMALITILCETYSVTLFDSNFGYTWFSAGLPVFQLAEYIGFKGLSTLTVLANLPLLLAWQQRKAATGKIMATTVAVVFVLLNALGVWLQSGLPQPDATANVLMIQTNIENSKKLAAEYGDDFRHEILKRYIYQTDEALQQYKGRNIDMVLWPETSIPTILGKPDHKDGIADQLSEYVKRSGVGLLTGAFGWDADRQLKTNSVFVLNPEGRVMAPHYSKSKLIMFGEYVPFEQEFPAIRNYLPRIGNMAAGQGVKELLALNQLKFGIQICYESLFPELSGNWADLGAHFIVNITNDSWFGHWQEPYQHSYMTMARAVEFRVPMLRVTNSGISSVALANGELLELSPIKQKWSGLFEVAYHTQPTSTFFQRWPTLVRHLIWVGIALLLAYSWLQRRKSTYEVLQAASRLPR